MFVLVVDIFPCEFHIYDIVVDIKVALCFLKDIYVFITFYALHQNSNET